MELLSEHKKNKKYYTHLIVSAYLLYIISIAIKLCYSAQLVVIGSDFGVSKTELSIGLTIYYVVYAIAQIIFSVFVKKIDLRLFIAITVASSGLSYGAIFFTNQLWQVWLILGINGIFQVAIWGGIMSIFGKYLPDYMVSHATQIMSTGMAVGTGLAYGFSALFTAVLTWRYTFIFFAVITFATIVYFFWAEKGAEKNIDAVELKPLVKTKNPTNNKKTTSLGILLLAFVSLLAFVISVIYYSLLNWVPNLLKEVHSVPESYSILISLLLPVSIFFGPFLGNAMCEKDFNYFKVGLKLSIIIAIFAVAMIFTYDLNVYGANSVVSLIVAIVGCLIVLFFTRAYMNVLMAYIPLRIRNMIETGKSSLITNACACVSAATAPFVTALIMDNFGWQALFIFIALICAILIVLLIFGSVWAGKRNFFKGDYNE
jgi:sugar phosphate permease